MPAGAWPHFPPSLAAVEEARIELPRRGNVPLARFAVQFNSSPKPVAAGFQQGWSARPQVSCDGQALFPEIAVLTLFQKEGWDGVWADLPRRKYFSRMPTQSKGVTLEPHVAQMLARVAGMGAPAGGGWPLILWHGKSVFFALVRGAAEAKAGPALRKAEQDWLEAGLRSGLAPCQFLVVEWSFRKVVVGRKRPAGKQAKPGPAGRPIP